MATRADLVRNILRKTFTPTRNSISSIFLSPELWDLVLSGAKGIGNALTRSPTQKTSRLGTRICMVVDYITTDQTVSLLSSSEPAPHVTIDVRRVLFQVQLLQQDLEQLDATASEETHTKLKVKIETLLKIVTDHIEGEYA